MLYSPTDINPLWYVPALLVWVLVFVLSGATFWQGALFFASGFTLTWGAAPYIEAYEAGKFARTAPEHHVDIGDFEEIITSQAQNVLGHEPVNTDEAIEALILRSRKQARLFFMKMACVATALLLFGLFI